MKKVFLVLMLIGFLCIQTVVLAEMDVQLINEDTNETKDVGNSSVDKIKPIDPDQIITNDDESSDASDQGTVNDNNTSDQIDSGDDNATPSNNDQATNETEFDQHGHKKKKSKWEMFLEILKKILEKLKKFIKWLIELIEKLFSNR